MAATTKNGRPDVVSNTRKSQTVGRPDEGAESGSTKNGSAIQQKASHCSADSASFEAREGEVCNLDRVVDGRPLETTGAGHLLRFTLHHEIAEPIRRRLKGKASHEREAMLGDRLGQLVEAKAMIGGKILRVG